MLCIHQFGSLETWITTIQILSIYGKNQPKTKLKHAAQNNKLSALSSAEIYRMVQLNQHEWHTDTCRHKMWVRILENKNVGYKSICIPGKVNNGLLNDLFQVYVYSPVFSHGVFKIPSFAIFIPQPRSPFYEQLQLWQNVCRPTQYKTKHLSLVLSKHRKYRAVFQLSLPVSFCLVHWTVLYPFTDYPSRDHNVKRWMVMLAWLCRFHVRNFRIWKELKWKLKRAQSSR